jgi:phospholipid-binding lipoprotein MlaA
MRYVAAASAVALGFCLASAAHAQTPAQAVQPEGIAPAEAAPAPAAEPAPEDEAAAEDEALPVVAAPGDPLESLNRKVYGFNDAVDRALIEPVAKGYRKFTPGFFRSGVRNFLHNLSSPVILANDVLQGEPKRAGDTVGRFALNTTVGVLGLFDVAEKAGIEKHDEDFGQTLGKWGVGPGAYLMLPFFGPSNVRDLTGRIVDIAIDPITYARFDHDDEAKAIRFGMDQLTQRTDAIDAIDTLRTTSIDPYAAARSVYEQSRESAIANGRDGAEDSPESQDNLSE